MPNRTPEEAAAAFRERLRELGAELLEPEWLGTPAKHHVRCSAGHDCHPIANDTLRGKGICRICARRDPASAEAAFRARLEELEATPLFDKWLGTKSPHHVRCVAGHDCYPSPSNVRQGLGICRACKGLDSAGSEARFRLRLAELGAELLEPYVNCDTPRHVRCAGGHDCYPRPHDARRQGICKICAKCDTATAAAAFRAHLTENGAELLEPKWLGAHAPHLVRCARGHLCRPSPSNIVGGRGICRSCAWSRQDVFYVVTGAETVKFGITSGDPRSRLRDHATQGYGDVTRLVTGLPEGLAFETETAVKLALAAADESPLRGQEYFSISCLALILDIADSWLAPNRDGLRVLPAA